MWKGHCCQIVYRCSVNYQNMSDLLPRALKKWMWIKAATLTSLIRRGWVKCGRHISVEYIQLNNWLGIPLSLTYIDRMYVHHRRLVRGGLLIIMAGMEWYQMFDVFETIPFIPFHPLLWAHPSQLRCHQPPVTYIQYLHTHTLEDL